MVQFFQQAQQLANALSVLLCISELFTELQPMNKATNSIGIIIFSHGKAGWA